MQVFNETTPNAAAAAIAGGPWATASTRARDQVATHAAGDAPAPSSAAAGAGGIGGGQDTPINGFLHFNAMETLPSEPLADTAPLESRYDNLIAVFGGRPSTRSAI